MCVTPARAQLRLAVESPASARMAEAGTGLGLAPTQAGMTGLALLVVEPSTACKQQAAPGHASSHLQGWCQARPGLVTQALQSCQLVLIPTEQGIRSQYVHTNDGLAPAQTSRPAG